MNYVPTQAARALDRANAVRFVRSKLKGQIARGEVPVADVILEPPDEALGWAIAEVLACQRRWGPVRCERFLGRHRISENKALGALTVRQRHALAAELVKR